MTSDMAPLAISVVIPLYNKAPHIKKTLESVLSQSSPANEIIVVDDGSTDGGAEVVKLLAENYPIKLIQQKNLGVSAARNTGVTYASSEFVAFLDADDWWLPNHLSVLRMLIHKYDEASLFSTAHVIVREGKIYRPKSYFEPEWSGYVDRFFYAYSKGLSLVNSSTACVRKEALIAVNGFPIGVKRGEDIICWINLALNYKVAHAEIVTTYYNQNAVNRSTTTKETAPPASLIFLVNLMKDSSKLSSKDRKDATLVYEQIAAATAAGFLLNNDAQGALLIQEICWSHQQFVTFVKILLIRLLPLNFLKFIRCVRHRTVDTS